MPGRLGDRCSVWWGRWFGRRYRRVVAPTLLWENARWRIVLPERALTVGHVAIVDRDPARGLDHAGASGLIDAYRRSRSGLRMAAGCEGFQVSFAVRWEPDALGIGEPDPLEDAVRVVHVFGRKPDDPTSPVRAMTAPRPERLYATVDAHRVSTLEAALAAGDDIEVVGPPDRECTDGCGADVLTQQERWRAGGVRVIRPRRVIIDSHVIVLPLRHVVSIGELTAEEIVSVAARLEEVRDQFGLASGVTGLNCFVNDGSAARQETPHAHLHVLGRSRDEATNPFELLGRRLTPPTAPATAR